MESSRRINPSRMASVRNLFTSFRGTSEPPPRSRNRQTINAYSAATRSSLAPAGLHGERLHKMVVFELREDGSTEYSTMTLRALYNYVVTTITESCKQANLERNESKRNLRHGLSQREMFPSVHSGRSTNDNDGAGIGIILEDEDEEEEADQEHESPNQHESPNPITSFSPYTHTTPSNVPPHLPSLSSSNATPPTDNTNSLPTPITSNQGTEDSSPHHLHNDNDDTHHNHLQSKQYIQGHQRQRAAQTSFTPLPNNGNTHRERLGGYLHPRDMRRLVTPFSSSNEPQLMVRRHVMLLNFDPLRAVVLRDRLLVLVPDGADSLLIALERRVRGGIAEMENQVFGDSAPAPPVPTVIRRNKSGEHFSSLNNPFRKEAEGSNFRESELSTKPESSTGSDDHTERTIENSSSNDEWEDMQRMDLANMPYELQSVDAVLQTVIAMLMEEARKVQQRSATAIRELRGDSPHKRGAGGLGEHAQERLRLHKDEVNLMEGRVQGFVRAMNEVLDEDEDMTLMNLSRLLTHPDRFLQPVSREILHEESDEPELILEAHLQQALSIVNELDLLKSQIMTTEEQISMTLDAIRNRLLYINTLLSVASLVVGIGSFVGSIFGMNLTNGFETNETAWMKLTVGTIVAMVFMWAILSWVFNRAAKGQSAWSGKKYNW